MASALANATFAVIDLETTGLDPRVDRVVEIACLRVRGGVVLERFASLVNPRRPIPPGASRVHGIFDADVAAAPTLAELQPRICRMTADAVVVAHNARFDVGFLSCVASRPTLCTLMLARRLLDAPSYRNEALREYLGLKPLGDHARAHRAEADAAVTAALLLELLRRFETGPYPSTVEALFSTIARPIALARLGFGRHRGKTLVHVPSGYLRWIVANDFESWPDVRHTALLELRRRGIPA